MNKEDFQILIKKYLKGEADLTELQRLINYYESFQEEHEWVEELGSEETLKTKMLISILERIEDTGKVKRIPFYRTNWFTYGVAASLVLLVMINIFYKVNLPITTSIQENQIEIGSSKATLTLSSGEEIFLAGEKDFLFNTAKSNGKELIYEKTPASSTQLSYNTLTIPRGGQFYVELADGTKVWLNSDSQLKYPESFAVGEPRTVELVYGEAFFEASPSSAHNGTRFKVNTNNQEVEVLGTEFNVKAYKEEANVLTTLIEGTIQLNTHHQKAEVLKPGQQSVLNKQNGNLLVSKVDTDSEIAWRNGLFSFNDKSLLEIMKVLSRWYDVDVNFEDETLKEVTFNGQLKKNQELSSILKLIKNTNFITDYEIKNNTIILK
ncbi:FecR family protein [Leeuwenhoekiella aestuarii]|uniref:FecR family protein n=1 Tax=Leeuwenhoekiella aestuarii TaxID=2249426 RepID=A0A4Q0NQ30_9FLAO|nr:FecR family protein [Leeuwenhoekiella aestuarii]RXG11399.1 FecR family protein [Leeuwenhoekiella aestuarii]RXG12136.1 FecR family protein [Leeuwenhoekiella aestuarii]